MSSPRDPAPEIASLPAFDPEPSARLGCEVLTEVGSPFALIGKVAMWTLLPPAAQEFTKDVDFAIPVRFIEPVRAALARRGIAAQPLSIGGLGVREGEISVDFIDRHEGGRGALFEEAIADAQRHGRRVRVGDALIPVVQAEYLVALKVAAAEDRDEGHAVQLLRALPGIDVHRVREILRRLLGPLAADRLDALARRADRPDARPDSRNSG